LHHALQRLGRIACFTDDFYVGLVLQEPADSLSHQHMIIGNQAPDFAFDSCFRRGWVVKIHHSSWARETIGSDTRRGGSPENELRTGRLGHSTVISVHCHGRNRALDSRPKAFLAIDQLESTAYVALLHFWGVP